MKQPATPQPFPHPPGRLDLLWRRLTLSPRQRLTRAVAERSPLAMDEAIAAGAVPAETCFEDGMPVLHAACQAGWLGGIGRLLSAEAAAVRLHDGRTVAHLAAPHGLALVAHLVNAGTPLDGEADIQAIGEGMPPFDRDAWKKWAFQARLEQAIQPAPPAPRQRL